MKSIKGATIGLVCMTALFIGINSTTSARAQAAQTIDTSGTPIPDSIVQVTAEAAGLEQVAPEDAPPGTYWLVLPGLNSFAPLPFAPFDPTHPIYAITSDTFLVDSTDGSAWASRYTSPRRRPIPHSSTATTPPVTTPAAAIEAQGNAVADLIEQVQEADFTQQVGMLAAAVGLSAPGFGDLGGGSGTNGYSPNDTPMPAPDYGTNLWIAQTHIANNSLAAIGTNTLADVQYEIQSRTNLAQTDWQSEGFIFGSELTNWTSLSVAQNSRTNLFVRLRSWADDGSGLPLWWQQQYFGTNGVDPYGNPMGDGWSNYQKFQFGWSPNIFYTPAAPQNVVAQFNAQLVRGNVSWQASKGSVTSYTVEKIDGYGTLGGYFPPVLSDFVVSSASTTFQDDLSTNSIDYNYPYGGKHAVSYRVRANYLNGNTSAWSSEIRLQPAKVSAQLSHGADGKTTLTFYDIPANASKIRLVFLDMNAIWFYGDTSYNYTQDIPISSLTNNMFQLPTAWVPPSMDGYDYSDYYDYVESVDSDGHESGENIFWSNGWADEFFYDGRVQLKQNLIFKLRAADTDRPFKFYYWDANDPYDYEEEFYNPPTNHVESSLLHITDILTDTNYFNPYDYYAWHSTLIDPQLPFFANYLFQNFVYSSGNTTSAGLLNTGVGNHYVGYSAGQAYYEYDLGLSATPQWKFQASSNAWSTVAGLLDASSTSWMCSVPIYNQYGTIYSLSYALDRNGIATSGTNFALASNAKNIFGLPFVTEKLAAHTIYSGNVSPAISSGATYGLPAYDKGPVLYAQTAQPQLQTVEYDFWSPNPVWDWNVGRWVENWLPGSQYFSPTNQSQQFFVPVGSSVSIAGYAKMAVQNGYSDIYAYLGQYFDKAYKTTNGVATTNTTGVLSPYGNFFATEPGDAALVTMPDLDTDARGTGIVHCVSLNVDKNHDGVMDLSFNGADVTSQASPMIFWVNNDSDWSYYDGDVGKDVVTPPGGGDYLGRNITTQRDLEDYARLWLCGLPALTNGNYQVTLSLNASANTPAINLVRAVETNGGTLYLTDTNTAAAQVAGSTSAAPSYKFARVTPSQPYTFPAGYFASGGNRYFLFEGAGIGSGELVVTLTDASGNVVAEAGVWLDLHDVKDLYEQAHADNVTSGLPPSSLVSQCKIDHATTMTDGETKQVVVFVHGINNTQFDYYNSTETLFKRLYWSGYHGKVAGFKWPCSYLPFENSINPFNYNKGEFYAWKSASALRVYLNYLRNRADLTNYTINVFAHSQGNVVASEAIKQGGAFDNYILSQGAIPAQCYDTSVPFQQKFLTKETTSPTPLATVNGGYHGYFAGLTGNLINFYNTNDYALAQGTWLGLQANWEENQVSQKPEHFVGAQQYIYASNTGVSTRYFGGIGPNDIVTDNQEIMSMVARSRTRAVGAEDGAARFGSSFVDLRTSFGFGKTREDHSAQFAWPIQRAWGYYDDVLSSFGINPIIR